MVPTEGHESVRRYAEKHTQRVTAERLSKLLRRPVSQTQVSRWASAAQMPAGDVVAAMHVLRIATAPQWLRRSRSSDVSHAA